MYGLWDMGFLDDRYRGHCEEVFFTNYTDDILIELPHGPQRPLDTVRR